MAAPLNDFTFYNNRSFGGIGDPNDPRAQAALQAVQKYDPNAQYVATQLGGEGGSGATTYTLSYDATKLPGATGGQLGQGKTGAGTGATFMPTFSTVQPGMTLTGPTRDGGAYGNIVDNKNIGGNSSWLDWVGPLAVGAFGAAFGGLPFLTQGLVGGTQAAAPITDLSTDAITGAGAGADVPLGSAESS